MAKKKPARRGMLPTADRIAIYEKLKSVLSKHENGMHWVYADGWSDGAVAKAVSEAAKVEITTVQVTKIRSELFGQMASHTLRNVGRDVAQRLNDLEARIVALEEFATRNGDFRIAAE